MDENRLFDLIMGGSKHQLQKISECNDYTKKFGLSLSHQDALQLLESRRNNLKQEERVEFGEGILPKLIYVFCDSPFIYQDNYVDILEGLQEIFYLYKNESLDELTDDELISYMKERFDGVCQGDLDYLEGTCLDKFCRRIRSQSQGFIGADIEDEEDELF
jgi:hypothetical protein